MPDGDKECERDGAEEATRVVQASCNEKAAERKRREIDGRTPREKKASGWGKKTGLRGLVW